jgi:hypothetical protein
MLLPQWDYEKTCEVRQIHRFRRGGRSMPVTKPLLIRGLGFLSITYWIAYSACRKTKNRDLPV